MSYDIIVRFPSKEMADKWASQMSDGFGEGYCSFSHFQQKPGTDGKKKEDFEKITASAPEGTPVFFVNRLFDAE